MIPARIQLRELIDRQRRASKALAAQVERSQELVREARRLLRLPVSPGEEEGPRKPPPADR